MLPHMATTHPRPSTPARVATLVRERISRSGDRLWRFEDFQDLPLPAVAKALSRLAKEGVVERLSKGTYYRPRPTAFGPSKPLPAALHRMAARHKPCFPSGLAAANLLGFSTQAASRMEVATTAGSLPRKLIGDDAIVHTRRPHAWALLPAREAALLDFLRQAGRHSELPPEETLRRTLALLGRRGCFERLVRAADSEPPRVRALLGALGEQLQRGRGTLMRLRASLNPLSRFDFGAFAGLPNAKQWQAKERRT